MEFYTAESAWVRMMNTLNRKLNAHSTVESRLGNSSEVIGTTLTILDPRASIITHPARKLSPTYLAGELLWYLSGDDSLFHIAKYSKFWNKITDNGSTVNSAYGYRIYSKFGFNQWEYVKKELTEHPDSRRAVIHLKNADNYPSKDIPCTVSLQFILRHGLLNLIVYMRSNDMWLGFPYDVVYFTTLQQLMAIELGVNLGNYHHMTGSLHLYEKNAVNVEYPNKYHNYGRVLEIHPGSSVHIHTDYKTLRKQVLYDKEIAIQAHMERPENLEHAMVRDIEHWYLSGIKLPVFRDMVRAIYNRHESFETLCFRELARLEEKHEKD